MRLNLRSYRPFFFLSLLCLTIFTCLLIQSAISAPKLTNSDAAADALKRAYAAKDCSHTFPDTDFFRDLDRPFLTCQLSKIEFTLQIFKQQKSQIKDFALSQDLALLIHSTEQDLREDALAQKYQIPYLDLPKGLSRYFSALLQGSTASKKRTALATLRQLVEPEPLVEKIEQQIRDRSAPLYLSETIEQDINPKQTGSALKQIKQLFEQHKLSDDYKPLLSKLEQQLTDYTTFLTQEVFPKSQITFRLPIDLYVAKLAEQGVDLPVETLIQEARSTFQSVQQQMQAIAPQIAQQKGFKSSNYRDVIRDLKQEQIPANKIIQLYQQHQRDIESIIKREHLVTLPKRGITIRLATAEENAAFPVPRYFAPSDRKKEGTFIIPVLSTNPQYNDFTYPAVTWTLTAHEGRPGHDLQFTRTQDSKISKARSHFGFNAANHEGWALYAESITKPFMPLDGQFISLQFQLLRAARAFLEPELQLGKITIADALKVLTEDAGYSRFFADQEIQRYTQRLPGQAPAYFYGYQQLIQLRRDTEAIQGKPFKAQQFHDFILSQGFLPPKMMREAVLHSFHNSATVFSNTERTERESNLGLM
jgi:uncharacterized protein (DUF885 family)